MKSEKKFHKMMKSKARLQFLLLLFFSVMHTVALYAGGVTDHKIVREMSATPAPQVRVGGSITAKLASEDFSEAQISVENALGKVLMHKAIVLDPGTNLLKFNISEIPAGAYFIKIQSEKGTNAITFVVK
jgi:hypothetical protein